LKLRSNIVGVALLCLALGCQALTLGRVRGAALVGRQLDIVVPVQIDAGEDAASLCFEADVFHGDTRQEASRVRVMVEPTTQAQAVNVRILSSAVVDEPVVTVYLRTGCEQKTTRRYVLLADFPSEVAVPTVPQKVTPVTAALPVDTASVLPVAGSSRAVPTRPVAEPKPKVKKVRVPKEVVANVATSKPPESKNVAPSVQRTQSRLELDPLELLSDRVANIDSYMAFTPPEDAIHTMQKMQTLESDMKALQLSSSKSEAALADLKARLKKAESERFPRGLVFALIALVLICLAVITFLMSRQRRMYSEGSDWWAGAGIPSAVPPEPEPLVKFLSEPPDVNLPVQAEPDLKTLSSVIKPVRPVVAEQVADTGVKLMEMSESDFDQLMQHEAEKKAVRKPSSPVAPEVQAQKDSPHLINTEATLDIRQQAEFFISLGQTDRAVRILKKQIDEGDEPNPFVYLDLLSIFHSLGLKNEFQLLRKDFNLLFNGRVPEFARFKDEGLGLESYPEFLTHLTALWSTPKALELIESSIFQDPWDAKSQHFDLAAFRDLLLLHAIAQQAVAETLPEISEGLDFSDKAFLAHSELDLDLSDSTMEKTPSAPEPDAAVTAGGELQIDMGNLINFDLPEVPPRQA